MGGQERGEEVGGAGVNRAGVGAMIGGETLFRQLQEMTRKEAEVRDARWAGVDVRERILKGNAGTTGGGWACNRRVG